MLLGGLRVFSCKFLSLFIFFSNFAVAQKKRSGLLFHDYSEIQYSLFKFKTNIIISSRMRHTYPKAGAVLLSLAMGALAVSCIDDNYDLSDIDTTTEVKVNDLTVPVNFKDIYLNKIIDLDESNPDAVIKIREENGVRYYCFSKGGSFDANPKSIDKVNAPAPEHPESSNIHIQANSPVENPAASPLRAPAAYQEYTVTPYTTSFDYHVGSGNNPRVDDAIKTLRNVTLDKDGLLKVTLRFESEDIAEFASRTELYDLVVIVPEGSEASCGSIKSVDGKLTIPHLESTNGILAVTMEISYLDFVTEEEPEGKVISNGKFDFTENVGVESGRFQVFPREGIHPADMPREIDFNTYYDMSGFVVSNFSGTFDYAIDFDEVDAFNLTDLPSFLSKGQTNIILARPMLTLDLNSPVAEYGLDCVSGLTLKAERADAPSSSAVLNEFFIGHDTEKQFHVLAPNEDYDKSEIPVGVTPHFTSFPGLATILSGEGLPQTVRVDFSSPEYPDPRVIGSAENFPLGKELDQVHGEYTFSAPLALADGSVIIYKDTVDGWNDEDVDAIAISKLRVTAKVSSDIPAGAKVYVLPIDVKGNRIPLTNESTAFATMPALASDYEISLELLGDIRHLDGIYIEAIVDDFDGKTLSPDSKIKVSDLRATVTGSYTKKL